MTSVRTEARKRAVSEVVEVASDGLYEVYMIDTEREKPSCDRKGSQSPAITDRSIKPSSVVIEKMPKFSSINIAQDSSDEHSNDIIEVQASPKDNGDMQANTRKSLRRSRPSGTSEGSCDEYNDDIMEVQSSPKNNGDMKANIRKSLRRSRPSGTSQGPVETKKSGEDKEARNKYPSLENQGATRRINISFSKRTQLSRNSPQGPHAVNAVNNAPPPEKIIDSVKSGVSQVGSPSASFSLLPYVKLMPLPSSVTVSLDEGHSVNITEFLSDLERMKKTVETVDLDDDIKVEPEEYVDETFNMNVVHNMSHCSNDYTRTEIRNHGRPTKQNDNQIQLEALDQLNNDTMLNHCSHGRTFNSIDDHIKAEVLAQSTCAVGTEKRRNRGKPPRFDDFVYDLDQMVTNKLKTVPKKKTNSVKEKGVLRRIKRPQKVKGKRKIKKSIKRQNIKEIIDVLSEDIKHSKNAYNNSYLENATQSPKNPINKGRSEANNIFEVEDLQGSNKAEAEEIIISGDETSQGNSEINLEPEIILEKKRRAYRERASSSEEFIEDNTCYVVVNHGTQRGSKRLVGSDGYTYNVTRSSSTGRIYWRCSYRPASDQSCSVVVKIDGDVYMRRSTHNHDPEPEAFVKSLVSGELKKRSLTDFHHRPREVIEKILKENEALISRSQSNFNISYLVRRFNRTRHRMKKKNPLISSLKLTGISVDFLIEDVVFGKKRHMLFATKKQLQLLARTDRWYIDITCKFVRKPFTHLFSVSSYVQDDTQGDGKIKLKPLAFAIMSCLQVMDVVKVLRALLKHLRKPLLVRSFVLDFFEPLWMGVRRLFFNCKLYGCAWKFGQCIWAKIQRLGITDDQVGLYDEIHKLLKLPFMHPKNIRSTFEMLKVEFLADSSFEEFIKYMECTWLNSRVWKISNWCVHGNPFRTKVEVIGWHYAISATPKCNILGTLIHELRIIATSIPDCTKPAHQKRVREHYLENETTPQGKIYKLWARESSMRVYDFLSLCCEMSEPTMEGMVEKMIEEFSRREKCP